jgi:hypothetical protein
MSRTKRNIEHSNYFTKPKTHNYRKGLLYSKQEIKEELGNKYLSKNNQSHKKIPSNWDDKPVSGRAEVPGGNKDIMEKVFLNKLEVGFWYLRLNFNSHKNRYEIGKRYTSNLNSYYIPFCIKYKEIKYPVVIYPHNWN